MVAGGTVKDWSDIMSSQEEQLEAILLEYAPADGMDEGMVDPMFEQNLPKLVAAITALIQEAVNEGRVAVPDDIKGVTVSGVATLQNEMDTVSIQDLRLIIDELRPKGSGGSNNG